MSDLEPLDEDVLALLASAKAVPELSTDAKDALFASVSARLPTPPGPGGDGGTGGAPPTSGFALSGTRALATIATTFVLGTGAGVLLDRALTPAPAPASPIATTTPAVASAPTSAAAPAIPGSATPVVAIGELPNAAAPTRSAATTVASARGLAAERALLDVARSALARGAPDEALAAAERHAREYPDGALVEEREALTIKALLAVGRRGEARARADAFERKFPNALGLRAIRAALEER